jgi:hypothetical protein
VKKLIRRNLMFVLKGWLFNWSFFSLQFFAIKKRKFWSIFGINNKWIWIQNIGLMDCYYRTVQYCKISVDSARSSRLPQEARIFYFCTCIGEFCYTRKYFEEPFCVNRRGRWRTFTFPPSPGSGTRTGT